MKLQTEMLKWSSGRSRATNRFDGTILGLSRRYQVDAASPFQRLKHTTRHEDTCTLGIIGKSIGGRARSALKIGDFYRWYDAAKKPKEPGGSERGHRAYVEAFVAAALAKGCLSLALGTAIQFETALRQKDVIGE